MRIVMTGATGLIGREVGKALVLRGDAVTCLVRDVDSARRNLPLPAGWLGSAIGGCKVDSDVGKLFAYRALRIDERFGR